MLYALQKNKQEGADSCGGLDRKMNEAGRRMRTSARARARDRDREGRKRGQAGRQIGMRATSVLAQSPRLVLRRKSKTTISMIERVALFLTPNVPTTIAHCPSYYYSCSACLLACLPACLGRVRYTLRIHNGLAAHQPIPGDWSLTQPDLLLLLLGSPSQLAQTKPQICLN
ncbi:hypothetical protein ABW19_dt0201950 [Dactylella cylindrospora]|nr:hypothetical protein ABW19_dt0201950 [Dactylella cylindrospora]